MSSSPRLIDQTTDSFPFNKQTYERITEGFDVIERRFRSLQHSGNTEAKHLADMTARINGLVYDLWDAVVEAEDREREGETRTRP